MTTMPGHSAAMLLATVAAILPVALPAQPPIPAQAQVPALEDGFRDPPAAARPRVWWHWMDGNISVDGIAKDIAWMARVGIGGMQSFDAAVTTPQIVDTRLAYMTPAWKAAFRAAAREADAHGLELATASSPGWSETGGPWVKPRDGMKKLVWSETVVEGSRRFTGRLAPIPSRTGPFLDLAAEPDAASPGARDLVAPAYAADVAVLAYRIDGDGGAMPPPRMTAGDRALDAAVLTNGRFADGIDIDRGSAEAPAAVSIDYGRPRTIRSLTLFLPGAVGGLRGTTLAPVLEAGDADGTWRRIADVPLSAVPVTVSFAPATARRFRLVLAPRADAGVMGMMGATAPGVDMAGMLSAFGPDGARAFMPATAKTIRVAELSLHAEARVNAFEKKAGFAIAGDYYALDGEVGPDLAGVEPGDVVNLSRRMTADGRLDWTPPKGRWRILRLGYSLIGKMNHPATREATGLEVDKYDGRAVRDYIQTYIGLYAGTTGEALIGAHGLRALVSDSIEVGPSNWTPDLIAQFRRLRGYDPTPWLPALTGVVIGSRAQSDGFLYDFRHTLADLLASQHYAIIADAARAHGLTYYSEALESSRVTLGDDMAMRAPADIPMSMTGVAADMKGAASVAHIYGKPLVAAESLTSAFQPWATAPADLRPKIDLAFATGINRPVIHTSVHQPVDDKQPGLALLIFGQYFNRHESWAEMARPWVDYLARNAFLLQQGRDHADVGYFYGEDAPLVELFRTALPKDAPRRYGYDFVNADAIADALKVDGGELVTPGGARYRLLYLGGSSRHMTLPTLRRLDALVAAGATILGEAPIGSPALGDDATAFAAIVARLWGDGRGGAVGRGRVIAGTDIEAALASIGVEPDFAFAAGTPDSNILFQHRTLPDGEIYFLSNQTAQHETGEARFRVVGRVPEIWRADTGEIQPVSYRIEQGYSVVPLDIAGSDSFFIVFRKPATAPATTVATPTLVPLGEIGGGWTVDFQPGRGAPAQANLPRLASLSDSAAPGIRYFSGVATYRTGFRLPRGASAGQPLLIDLGKVGDLAEVRVNGVTAGTVWREPHRLDIGRLVKPGVNRIEIRVADLWVNRLIGDAQPGATKIGWTSTPVYRPDAPLRPSGLIGPVRLFATAGPPSPKK